MGHYGFSSHTVGGAGTYNIETEWSDCCGAAVTGTTDGIACKRCWELVSPRLPDPERDALAKRKHEALLKLLIEGGKSEGARIALREAGF